MTVINPGGGGAVASVFGRTGAVVAAAADYTPAQVGTLLFGTAAARPAAAAANNGVIYYATDTGEVTLSNGAAWNSIAKINVGNGTLNIARADGTAELGLFATNGSLAGQGGIGFGTGTAQSGLGIQQNGNNQLSLNAGDWDIATAGRGLRVAEGANAKQGTAVLVAGAVVVANTSVTATSRIFVTSQVDGGTPGFLRVSTRTAGTSFTITSSSGTDTSTVAWEMFEVG